MEDKLDPTRYPSTTNSFAAPYIRLRSVLDALHANALQYCLREKDENVRIQRAQEIEALLRPALQRTGGSEDPEGGCGEGFYNCGGVCVPYPCP